MWQVWSFKNKAVLHFYLLTITCDKYDFKKHEHSTSITNVSPMWGKCASIPNHIRHTCEESDHNMCYECDLWLLFLLLWLFDLFTSLGYKQRCCRPWKICTVLWPMCEKFDTGNNFLMKYTGWFQWCFRSQPSRENKRKKSQTKYYD